jgi:hypothetical protein
MLGFDTTNIDVRSAVGSHFEAVAKACGVHPKELSDYFEAQVSGIHEDEEERDQEPPKMPKYLVFSSLHFSALLEELRVKIRSNNNNNNNAPSSPAPHIGDLRKGKSMGNIDGSGGRRNAMKQTANAGLSRGSMR